ncbi:MAG: DUF1127 domain-containing protein [Alphaproteobacteria bacterium]|jgi:uncharacterized protein YjiS (DUF1127 family)
MSITLSLPKAKVGKSSVRLVAVKLLGMVSAWRRRMRHRAELRHLLDRADDRMLSDVGLSRPDLCDEAGRPFWQK